MTPSLASPPSIQDKRLQKKILELQGKKHLPEELVALVSEVSRLQNEYMPQVSFNNGRESLGEDVLSKLSPKEKRSSGVPILSGKDFPLDMPLVSKLANALLSTLPGKVPSLSAYSPEIAVKIAEPGFLEAVCREALDTSLAEEDLPLLTAWAKEHPDAPHFLRFLATSAAMPSLVVTGRILGEEHNQEKVWQHGHCPVCGSLPLVGSLVDKEGRRMHSCSFCSFEYRAPRMGCPFCLASETEGSEYHVSEDEPGYLLSVCKSCHNYIKLGDFREFNKPWFPLLDDLSSLTLDLYAMQLGYKRPTLSGWGF